MAGVLRALLFDNAVMGRDNALVFLQHGMGHDGGRSVCGGVHYPFTSAEEVTRE